MNSRSALIKKMILLAYLPLKEAAEKVDLKYENTKHLFRYEYKWPYIHYYKFTLIITYLEDSKQNPECVLFLKKIASILRTVPGFDISELYPPGSINVTHLKIAAEYVINTFEEKKKIFEKKLIDLGMHDGPFLEFVPSQKIMSKIRKRKRIQSIEPCKRFVVDRSDSLLHINENISQNDEVKDNSYMNIEVLEIGRISDIITTESYFDQVCDYIPSSFEELLSSFTVGIYQ